MAQQKSHPIDAGATLAGRYELLKIIGQGGMGCVFLARHKQVGRHYAVKVLWRRHDEDKRICQRFLQEAKIAGSLSHVNLTSVYDYGETEEGYPFIVMDFVDGVSLSELLDSHERIDIPRAIGIFRQICAGLLYAHEKGLVHRDLKPANVMLVNHEGAELVKIVDFGIAKVIAKPGENVQELTGSGEIFGSPYYASPEQCMGQSVDARSDVYSLGCLMFQVLTGHRPVEGENPIQTIIKHIQQQPPSFAEVRPDHGVPEALENIVLKCMAKSPDERYQSVAAVSEELSRFRPAGAGSGQAAGDGRLPPLSPAVFLLPAAIVLGGIALAVYLGKTADHTERPQIMTGVTQPFPAAGPSKGPSAAAVVSPDRSVLAGSKSKLEKPAGHAPDAVSPGIAPVPPGNKAPAEAGKSGHQAPHHADKQAARTKSLAMTAPALLRKAQRRLAHLQSVSVPRASRDVNRATGIAIRWNIDWSSFAGDPTALETFEYTGLEEIREAMSEVAQRHDGQVLEHAITEIRVENVPHLYDRRVALKSGVLTIYGAWGQGIKGSPTSLEIRLAVAAAI